MTDQPVTTDILAAYKVIAALKGVNRKELVIEALTRDLPRYQKEIKGLEALLKVQGLI